MDVATVESESGMDLLNKEKRILSPLMLAKKNAKNGQKVNACPFGCTVAQLDEVGFCKHVVGITLPGDQTRFEPMIRRRGRRVVQVDRERIPTGDMNGDGEPEFEWGPPRYEKVQPGDVLVRITSSARVYRENVPEPARQPAAEAVKPMTPEERQRELESLRERMEYLQLEAEMEDQTAG